MRSLGFIAFALSFSICSASIAQQGEGKQKDLPLEEITYVSEGEDTFCRLQAVSSDGSLVALEIDIEQQGVTSTRPALYTREAGVRLLPLQGIPGSFTQIALAPDGDAALLTLEVEHRAEFWYTLCVGDLSAFVRTGDESLLTFVEIEMPSNCENFWFGNRFYHDGTIAARWEARPVLGLSDDDETKLFRALVRLDHEGEIDVVRKRREPREAFVRPFPFGDAGELTTKDMNAFMFARYGPDEHWNERVMQYAVYRDPAGELMTLPPLDDIEADRYTAHHITRTHEGELLVWGERSWSTLEPKPWPEPTAQERVFLEDLTGTAYEEEWALENTIFREEIVRWIGGKPQAMAPTPEQLGSETEDPIDLKILWVSADGSIHTGRWEASTSMRRDRARRQQRRALGLGPAPRKESLGWYIWTETHGFENGAAFLRRNGYHVPEDEIIRIVSLSHDGSTVLCGGMTNLFDPRAPRMLVARLEKEE